MSLGGSFQKSDVKMRFRRRPGLFFKAAYTHDLPRR
jgi:hypothetical protein